MKSEKKIGMIGCGYVGLITGVCFAELGNQVICYDINQSLIQQLWAGEVPIYEENLPELLAKNSQDIYFTLTFEELLEADFLFICVGTPPNKLGQADTRSFYQVVDQLNAEIQEPKKVVIKSTVPVGTAEQVRLICKEKIDAGLIHLFSNPEFLREGKAIHDFMFPDRIVIGSDCREKGRELSELYTPIAGPVLYVSHQEAELIKYASNNFLATKISFINEMANICDRVGADILQIANGIGLDHRIGREFLQAGLGFGGPCLNKDLSAMIHFCQEELGYQPRLLEAVERINDSQIDQLIDKLTFLLGSVHDKKVGVLGLSFKPGTADMRNAPALRLIPKLLAKDVQVSVYDPQALPVAKEILKNQVAYAGDVEELARNSWALIIVTDWPEFLDLDFLQLGKEMELPLLVDGRNMFGPEEIQNLRKQGFMYMGMGHA